MISKSNIESIVTVLAGFGTRHTQSNQTDPTRGIGAARDWIAGQMHGFAAKAVKGTSAVVTTPSYIQGVVPGAITAPTNITNIIGTIQGVTDPNRVYVVSGHYDSRCTDLTNFESDAPGADDDASGGGCTLTIYCR
jgi:Zn-dependent M28 family amino/carboxypeptidase